MRRFIIAFLTFLSSCYTYPGKYCPDDVYYSVPRNNSMSPLIGYWGYSSLSPYQYPLYVDPIYRGYYYTPTPRVNVYVQSPSPSPVLPPQPRRIVTSPQPKKTEQNNNQHRAPIRKF